MRSSCHSFWDDRPERELGKRSLLGATTAAQGRSWSQSTIALIPHFHQASYIPLTCAIILAHFGGLPWQREPDLNTQRFTAFSVQGWCTHPLTVAKRPGWPGGSQVDHLGASYICPTPPPPFFTHVQANPFINQAYLPRSFKHSQRTPLQVYMKAREGALVQLWWVVRKSTRSCSIHMPSSPFKSPSQMYHFYLRMDSCCTCPTLWFGGCDRT